MTARATEAYKGAYRSINLPDPLVVDVDKLWSSIEFLLDVSGACVILRTATGVTPYYGATDAARGTALIAAVAAYTAGDVLILGPGTFDLSAGLAFTDRLQMQGSGSATIISYAGDAILMTECHDSYIGQLKVAGTIHGIGSMNTAFDRVEVDATGRNNGILMTGDNSPAVGQVGVRLLGCDVYGATQDGVLIQDGQSIGCIVGESRFTGCGLGSNDGQSWAGLRITYGNMYTVPAGHWYSGDGSSFPGPVISSCWFAWNYTGLYINTAHNFVATNCQVKNNTHCGLHVVSPIESVISNCNFEYNSFYGLRVAYPAIAQYSTLSVQGNIFNYNYFDLRVTLTGAATENYTLIQNNFFTDVVGSGGTNGAAVYFDDIKSAATRFKISNNYVRGRPGGDAPPWGIVVQGASSAYSVSGQITGNTLCGAFSTASILCKYLDDVLIEGNHCSEAAYAIDINNCEPKIVCNTLSGTTGVITNTGGSLTSTYENDGFVTEASGTATVLNTTTYIDVTHGLAVTPGAKDIAVTPTNSMGAAVKFYISNFGATTFRINTVDAAGTAKDPGATTATFAWRAAVRP